MWNQKYKSLLRRTSNSLVLQINSFKNLAFFGSPGSCHSKVRNFSWNLTFFEWKRLLHNAVDKTPENAPQWFQTHLDWLRSLGTKGIGGLLLEDKTWIVSTLAAKDSATNFTEVQGGTQNLEPHKIQGPCIDIY